LRPHHQDPEDCPIARTQIVPVCDGKRAEHTNPHGRMIAQVSLLCCEPSRPSPVRLAPTHVLPPRIARGPRGWWAALRVPRPYADGVLDLAGIDYDEIAMALADQSDYEHRWLVDPRTGEVVFWTSDTGIDGENPVDLDELNLIVIDPVLSYVWYQDMVDFAKGISDRAAGRDLSRSLDGRGRSGGSATSCTNGTRS
jgi:hypothetical protein